MNRSKTVEPGTLVASRPEHKIVPYVYIKLTAEWNGPILQVRLSVGTVEYIDNGWIDPHEIVCWTPAHQNLC